MTYRNLTLGFAVTGSFCTFDKIKEVMLQLIHDGFRIQPVFSFHTSLLDTRFGKAVDFRSEVESITGHTAITTIPEAEPLGPATPLDLLIIAPCTGNTLAKLANGITDTPVLMAAKAHLRNGRPVVIAISSNDALGANFKNMGVLMNSKNMYFVPFYQDEPVKKPNSLVSRLDLIPDTIACALKGEQLQPVLQTNVHAVSLQPVVNLQ